MTTNENPEAAFIAKITASTTHEVRNVLAIVKESAGLIGDMVRSRGRREPLKEDKLLRSVSRIDAQVARGAELLTNLNRFAHSLDQDQERIDLNEGAQRVASLCERFARQMRQEVVVQGRDEAVTIVASSLRFQMTLFAAVECCLDAMPGPGKVIVAPGRHHERPAVQITGQVDGIPAEFQPDQSAGWQRFVGLVDSIGARVGSSGGLEGVLVIFPEPEAA
jgi:C4-dicarboxylate-specific signal transduction histidine kinase